MRRGEHFWLWVSITITGIAVVATLVMEYPRPISVENLHFDYIGALVGILTIVVTILVCWQINQTISSRKDVLRASRSSMNAFRLFERDVLKRERERDIALVQLQRNVLILYRNSLYKEDLPSVLGQFLVMSVNALRQASTLREDDLCDVLCMDILDCIQEGKAKCIHKVHSPDIIKGMSEIPGKEKIFHYREVEKAINNLIRHAH